MPENSGIALHQIRELILQTSGHFPHKDWEKTERSAQELKDILLDGSMDGLSDESKQILKRVIHEGNCNAMSKLSHDFDENPQQAGSTILHHSAIFQLQSCNLLTILCSI